MNRWGISGRIKGTVAAMLMLSVSSARGKDEDQGVGPPNGATASEASNFHARAGFGVTPVAFRSSDHLPTAHHGVGAFFSAFAELPYRFSLGGGFDWERYSYETTTSAGGLYDDPVFPDETLTHTRLLLLGEWDVLERGLVNPYLLALAGLGWEHATKTDWQCSPKTASGPVFGGGVGVDIAAAPWLAVGMEYRIATMPIALSPTVCTGAIFPDEPMGPPSDFIPQRIALTLSVSADL